MSNYLPLRAEDISIEPWGRGDVLMDGSVRSQRGVRITHKATGVSGESDYYTSQLRNKEEALAILVHRLERLP